MIAFEKYCKLSTFLEKRTHEIWVHENEERIKKGEKELNGYEYSYSIADWFYTNMDDLTIYYAFNFSFLKNISANIPQAVEKLNNLFGTGNAQDVLDALYQISKTNSRKDEYIAFIRNLACCYVLFEDNDCLQKHILRIDMFRKLDVNKSDPTVKDFIGGMLHALKHFSINGKSLSTGKEINDKTDISQILDILPRIALAFVECIKNTPHKDCIAIPYKDTYYLKCGFYHEKNTDVYYLNTCFITDKDK